MNGYLRISIYGGTVKVTKEEHKSKNILRNSDHPIEQKSNFEHYIHVSQLI